MGRQSPWPCRARSGHRGSAGVVEQIHGSNDGLDGCRGFVTSRQSLDGMTRSNGVAWLLTLRPSTLVEDSPPKASLLSQVERLHWGDSSHLLNPVTFHAHP
ncbi:hypothetical protein ELH89_16115 [Rhizobium leguminosarum]|nr:hypothetical protein ELH89_16115 [Rhizobium leguminosarum]